MIKNGIDLKSINDLLEYDFFIPSYQRGYRWTTKEVEDLLNDLWDFYNKMINKQIDQKQFYCLQPIVVMQKEDSEAGSRKQTWVVIDGQQRLTTLYLLLYSQSELLNIKPYSIAYATRPDSAYFLNNLEASEEQKSKNIDYFHIARALKTIKIWFEKKNIGQEVIKNFFYDFVLASPQRLNSTSSVKVIWYEIKEEEVNPKVVFQRLNMGKIPLTNAELIKALFLSKERTKDFKYFILESAKNDTIQDSRNDSLTNAEFIKSLLLLSKETKVEVNPIRQVELAQEWDNMESAFQDNRFWYFLTNRSNEYCYNRIDFLFDLFTQKSKLEEDPYYSFLKFQELYAGGGKLDFKKGKYVETLDEAWKELRLLFQVLENWYNDDVIYHYVGYLICCEEPILTIYNLYLESNGTADFTQKLIDKIKSRFHGIELEDIGYGDKRAKEVLLLFNVETVIDQHQGFRKKYGEKEELMLSTRFPFNIYKTEKWDIEHINPQTENPLTSKKDQIEWLDYALKLPGIELNLKERIKSALQDVKSLNFEELFHEVISQGDNANRTDSNNNEEIDGLSNLTLLDAGTNRAYKNALFPTKRNTVIQQDKEGTFIPVCTKNLFLKYYTNESAQNNHGAWQPEDMRNYFEAIENKLGIYFKADQE